MGKESRSRRNRTQPPRDLAPPTVAQATTPAQLLAKYEVEPIRDLPPPVERFHLAIVTDVLAAHEASPGPTGVARATQTWHRHHDGFAASRPTLLNFGGAVKNLACATGCNHCCRSPVGVVAAEAVLVADFIDRTLSQQDRLALRQRMEERKAVLQTRDLLRTYELCPLNVAGRCLVYDVRPHNCRVFHSFDADACARHFVADSAQRSLPIDPIRKQYDGLISASAHVALRALSLDTRNLEFMAALGLALDAGDRRSERLAAGESLFASLPTVAPPA